MEIWKDIKGYENLYKISNNGRVRSIKRNKNLTQSYSAKGYCFVTLVKDKIPKGNRVHRLVAQAFIKNKLNKLQVNHINSIRDDNVVENLEWVTNQENTRYRKKMSKKTTSKYKGVSYYPNAKKKKWRACIMLENKNKHIGNFKTEEEAAIEYNRFAINNYGKFALINKI